MPKSSAQSPTGRPTWPESKPRCATAPITQSGSPTDCAGDVCSMAALVQDRVAHSRLVVKAGRCHNRAIGVEGTDQPFALQRYPDCRIAQPARITRDDYGLAEMKMIAVRLRRPNHDGARLLTGPGVFAKARELL